MSQASNEAVLAAAEAENREFLVFSLGDEEYAIDILKVQEIRGYENVTRIANAPDFIKGVTNLRGVIVPIVDLRIKFNVGEATYNADGDQPGANSSAADNSDETVVDAEFEEVDADDTKKSKS